MVVKRKRKGGLVRGDNPFVALWFVVVVYCLSAVDPVKGGREISRKGKKNNGESKEGREKNGVREI